MDDTADYIYTRTHNSFTRNFLTHTHNSSTHTHAHAQLFFHTRALSYNVSKLAILHHLLCLSSPLRTASTPVRNLEEVDLLDYLVL